MPVKGNYSSELTAHNLLDIVDVARPSAWAKRKIQDPLDYKEEHSELSLEHIDCIVTNHHKVVDQEFEKQQQRKSLLVGLGSEPVAMKQENSDFKRISVAIEYEGST